MVETLGNPKIQDFQSTTTNGPVMWRNAATLSVNRMVQPSSHLMTASLGELCTGCPPSSHQLMQLPPPPPPPPHPSSLNQQCTLKTQDEDRIPGYWPQIADMRIKGMISVSPDSCILPYIEKHLFP